MRMRSNISISISHEYNIFLLIKVLIETEYYDYKMEKLSLLMVRNFNCLKKERKIKEPKFMRRFSSAGTYLIIIR